MNGNRSSTLFVSHEATRTGAPMMLLHLLRWLRDQTDQRPEIALLQGGPLADEFAALGPTHLLGDELRWPARTLAETALVRLGRSGTSDRVRAVRLRRDVRVLRSAQVVYLNSTVSMRLLPFLGPEQIVICHVHELETGLRSSLSDEEALLLRTRVDHVIAAADCVAENLRRSWGVEEDRLTRLYEFVDADAVGGPPQRAAAELRAGLGIPAEAPVVGGSGSTDWRKGVDLFIQVARTLVGRGSDAHFLWVGGHNDGPGYWPLETDIRHAGLEGRVHFVGLQARPHDWFRLFDVFTLTSREDPYPLVGLEAALHEVPMVCFAGAGGMEELVRRQIDGGPVGVAVPYLDVVAMADAVATLAADADGRALMGRRAATLVRRDHDVRVAAPQLLEIIERTRESARRS